MRNRIISFPDSVIKYDTPSSQVSGKRIQLHALNGMQFLHG